MNTPTLRLCVAAVALCASGLALARGDAANGKELATKKYACTSCHGENFATPLVQRSGQMTARLLEFARDGRLAA